MTNGDLNWIANYIWGIADDVLRDLYQRGKYRDAILRMTVLRRLDAVLEGGKAAVLDMKERLNEAGVVEQDAMLRQATGQTLQHVTLHTAGSACPCQPRPARSGFPRLSRWLLPQRAGHSQLLRVPQLTCLPETGPFKTRKISVGFSSTNRGQRGETIEIQRPANRLHC